MRLLLIAGGRPVALGRLLLGLGAVVLWAGAQTDPGSGRIGGTVREGWQNGPLGGVVVTLRGTTLAVTTDSTGNFTLQPVPAGEQAVVFSKPGYARATVTEVRVAPGQVSTVDLVLRPEFYEMEEYEVTAEELAGQNEQILFERQQSATFVDAMGSEQFRNLAVSDAAQVLSKVTGATVADGKYAVVRGLADRYTFTTLNGMDLPSADPDRKAFQLDLFPSSFMQRVDVQKTFTPDMGGGFAGGAINIVSATYPEQFLFEFRVGVAYNTQSSLRDTFPASDRGSTDWLGIDDGTRALPGEAAQTSPAGTAVLPAPVKGSFESSQFSPVTTTSPLDSSFSFQVGDTHQVWGRRLGFLAGMNYKNEWRSYTDGRVRSYDGDGSIVEIDKTDSRGVIDSQWGGLVNLALEMTEEHNFKFNFLYIQSAEDEARRLVGQDGQSANTETGLLADQSILHWTERNLTYFQLAGEHEFPGLGEARLDWGAAMSTTTQEEPDYRIFQFLFDPVNGGYNPQNTSAKPTRPTRYWRELEEDNANVRGDITVPLASYNQRENLLKTGAALSLSKRDYAQRGFEYQTLAGHPFFTEGDPNNYAADPNLRYLNLRNFPANLVYEGEQEIAAGYLMADWGALDWLQFIGGARYETTDLSIAARNLTNPGISPPPGAIDQHDLLPSLTAVAHIRTNLDVRLAWSQTVVRPTYREIAAVEVYDVTQNRTYFGNPALQVSYSDNYDLRAAWYPRPGEIVSIGVFAKTIQDPIELSSVTTDNAQITYVNFEEAEVFGVEAEFRLRLDRAAEELEDFTVGLNGAWIESEVPLTEVQRLNRGIYGDTATARPLYNQPSYIVNGDLTWDFAPSGTTVTLSGGVVGESLTLVGLASPDEFVQPAPELNLSIRQKLGRHWDIRFTAKNLLNPDIEVAQTWPVAGRQVLQTYTKGTTFGLSVGCKF